MNHRKLYQPGGAQSKSAREHAELLALSALCGAAVNAAFALASDGLASAITLRFLTGLFLAGVYPPGMRGSRDSRGKPAFCVPGQALYGSSGDVRYTRGTQEL
jgi:hypothetical protein